MNFLAIDFETNGFNAKLNQITELGAMLFEWTPASIRRLSIFGGIVWEPSYPPQPPEIIDVTGITDWRLKTDGLPFDHRLYALYQVCLEAKFVPEYFVAHNKAFDEAFFKAAMKNVADPILHTFFKIPWVCTLQDVVHPKRFKCRKLSHLALDYGVTVDPRSLHRATGDVQVLVDMIDVAKFDMPATIKRMSQKDIVVRAVIPSPFGPKSDGGKGKDAAKACGFGWNGKQWIKQIKEDELVSLRNELGYECAVIG